MSMVPVSDCCNFRNGMSGQWTRTDINGVCRKALLCGSCKVSGVRYGTLSVYRELIAENNLFYLIRVYVARDIL